MKRKKNILKRNSGFIVGCMLTAGVSFFAADIVMSQQMDLFTDLFETEADPIVIAETKPELPPEAEVDKVYETDAFTVTAAGTVIKGVETEPITEAGDPKDSEAGTESDASGENAQTSEGGSGEDSSYQSNDSSNGDSYNSAYGDDSYYDDNSSGDDSYYDDNSSGDDSYYDDNSSGDDYWYDGPNIEIEDSGNGDYYYDDSSSGSSSSGDSSWDDSWSDSGSGSDESYDDVIVEGEPSDILLPGITTRYITESELYNYSDSMIRYIRNEIFALHGRIFNSDDLREYFMQKSWYTPMYAPEDFDACMFSILNDYEIANLQVILKYEEALAAAN